MDSNTIKTIQNAQNGDRQAFESLYKQRYMQVYILALSILKDPDKAEDVLQDTFISVYNKIDTLKEAAAFPTWLFRIAINHCKSLMRKREEMIFKEGDYVDTFDIIDEKNERIFPVSYLEQKEKKAFIMALVNDLPIQQRTALFLFYYNDLSIKEIAQIMGANENTIKNRLFLSKRKIKGRIEKLLVKEGVKDIGYIYSAAPLSQIFTEYATENRLSPKATWDLNKSKKGNQYLQIAELSLRQRSAF